MAWRGPDDRVLEAHGDWFLGATRLAISHPAAAQPVRCAETGRVAVLNGAVTSAGREWPGGASAGRNDAELALLRMRAGGPAALTGTCGPHALAVLDPARDDLWLVRDPEGEKPLFAVSHAGQVVAFASTVAALRALGIGVQLENADVARFLRFGFALAPVCSDPGYELHTDMRGVYVARSHGGLRRLEGAPPEEAASGAELEQRVVHAVARCAAAEVPVGMFLSGGVDSSCMAAALSLLGQRVRAYQFCADGAPTEERARARAVAAATGMELCEVGGGPELLDALPWLTRCAGMPQGDPSVLAAYATARAARGDGIRVLLSGEGADDLWLGYRRHRAAAFLPARGWSHLPAPALATGAAGRYWRAFASATPYDALLEVTPPGFRRAVLEPHVLPAGDLPATGLGESALERARSADRAFYLRHDLLPKCDTALMAAQVEGRCPFLDPEVVAAPETRAEDPHVILGKRALKRAFRRHLPAGVLDRPKRGFGLPLDRWLQESDTLADVLCDRRTGERPHLRPAQLRRMLDLHRGGRVRIGHGLYLVAALELYLRDLERVEVAA